MFKEIATCISIIIFLIILACTTLNGISYAVGNVHLKITKDGKEIYNGRSACVNVKSAGDTTRVDISGGFLCMFPKAYYTGRDIETITLGDK